MQICSQLKCSSRTITKLVKDKDFAAQLEEQRELIAIDATCQTAAIVNDAIKIVAKGINKGDAKLAFDFLKETGVLKTTGAKLGMDMKNDHSESGLKVIINVSSDQFATNAIVIDAEHVESDHSVSIEDHSNKESES